MRRRRSGFVIGLVVFAGLVFLAISIYPTLFFSGSLTRSEGLTLERWRTRTLAANGLKIAANVLRVKRWWNAGSEGGPIQGVSTRTSQQFGFPEEDGKFTVVAQLVRHTQARLDPAGTAYFGLHHIDLYVRAEGERGTVVAYGAFLMTPTPDIWGDTTNGRGTGAATTKRLVRVTFFPESDFQEIENPGVREDIQKELKARSDLYQENYGKVNWAAPAPSPLASGIGDGQADSFLDHFASSGGGDVQTRFARDRLYDVVFEGVLLDRRRDARWWRRLDTKLQNCPQPGMRIAKLVCENVAGCSWVEPACATPDKWDLDPEEIGGRTVMQVQEEDKGAGAGDSYAEYLSKMIATEMILRDYDFGCSTSYSATLTEGEVPGSAFRIPDKENRWFDDCHMTISEPNAPRNFYLEADDEVGGGENIQPVVYDGQLFELFEFFKKYYTLDEGVPIPESQPSQQFDDDDDDGPPGPGDDDDDAGGGGGDGDDDDPPPPPPPPPPGGGGFGGGFSG